MKWYHYGLFFTVIFLSLFFISSTRLSEKSRLLFERQEEYNALTAASDAAVQAAFLSLDGKLSENGLSESETKFFQVLSAFLYGAITNKTKSELHEHVVCFAVFSAEAIYLKGPRTGKGAMWESITYQENGQIPELFYEKVTEYTQNYHNLFFSGSQKVKVKKVTAGMLDRELSKGCIFVLFAPDDSEIISSGKTAFLYTASKLAIEQYVVTEDKICHFPHCEEITGKEIIGLYTSEKSAAEHGANPCTKCFLLEE